MSGHAVDIPWLGEYGWEANFGIDGVPLGTSGARELLAWMQGGSSGMSYDDGGTPGVLSFKDQCTPALELCS